MAHCIFVDSRDRASGTASNFTLTLRESLRMDRYTRLRIDQVRVVNTFRLVNEDNRYLYVLEANGRVRVVTAEIGNYTGASLAANLQNWLGSGYVVEYFTGTNSLRISAGFAFQVLTDEDLLAAPATFPAGASGSTPKSLNLVLGNPFGSTVGVNNTSFTCNYVQLQPYDCVYLRSQRLASQEASGPNGSHDVLCKIGVDVVFGGVCSGEMPLDSSMSLGQFAFKTLDFQLTDRNRDPVTLQDGILTFVVTFS
jgi:hypothetical protein